MSIQSTASHPQTSSGLSVPASGSAGGQGLWGRDGFGFDDLIDIVNPLQHLPVVSSLYRAGTGDEIGHAPRLLGGLLFGGAAGFASAAVNVGVSVGTGKDLGEQVMAFVFGEEAAPPPPAPAVAARAYAVASGPPASHAVSPLPASPIEAPPSGATPLLNGARERLLAEVEARAGLSGRHDLTV